MCVGKGYFNGLDMMNVKSGEEYFRIEGNFLTSTPESPDQIAVFYHVAQGKTIFKNKGRYGKLADHVGRFPVVVIEPDDTWLINESGDSRRKMIDYVLSQVDADYLEKLIKYNRLLAQRNSLLKQFAESKTWNDGLLEVYDKQMEPLANMVFETRKKLIEKVKPYIQNIYAELAGAREEVRIDYESELHTVAFLKQMQDARARDKALSRTTRGVHKDDYELIINNSPLKKIGSQGQKKSSIIALKLALFHFVKEVKEITPILLLDDIFDKLDSSRTEALFAMISGVNFSQVFITDTSQQRLESHLASASKKVQFIRLNRS